MIAGINGVHNQLKVLRGQCLSDPSQPLHKRWRRKERTDHADTTRMLHGTSSSFCLGDKAQCIDRCENFLAGFRINFIGRVEYAGNSRYAYPGTLGDIIDRRFFQRRHTSPPVKAKDESTFSLTYQAEVRQWW